MRGQRGVRLRARGILIHGIGRPVDALTRPLPVVDDEEIIENPRHHVPRGRNEAVYTSVVRCHPNVVHRVDTFKRVG